MTTTLRSPSVILSLSTLHPPGQAAITGHWSFEAGDLFLSAKIGDPMLEVDADTALNEQFGTTGAGDFAGVANIRGQLVAAMKLPRTSPTGGYFVPPSTTANGAGNNINQDTAIMDILGNLQTAPLISTVTEFTDGLPNTIRRHGRVPICYGRVSPIGGFLSICG